MNRTDGSSVWVGVIAGLGVPLLALALGGYLGGWQGVSGLGLLGILALLLLTVWKVFCSKSAQRFWLNWILVSGWAGVFIVALSFVISRLDSRSGTQEISRDFGAAVITGGLCGGGLVLSAILVRLVARRYSKRAQTD